MSVNRAINILVPALSYIGAHLGFWDIDTAIFIVVTYIVVR